MPTKKPSAKQLAARAKFVKMVRAKAAKSKAAKKKTVKSIISKYKYIIQDSEAGNFIDKYITLNEAKKALLKFETQDKKEGIYKPYFYEIKNLNNKNIVGAVKKAAKKKTIKQTGTSNKVYDKRLQALKPGKRKTANPHKYRGKTIKKSTTYTENRENRSDKGRLLGIVKPKPTIISLAKKIAKLTNINDHNKSVLTLAKFLKNKNAISVMNNLIKMHNSYGFMPNELISLRKDILQNLFMMFKYKFGEIDYKLIYSSF